MSNGANNKIEITQSTLLKLLIRRGSDAERKNIVLSEGELGYTVDTKKLFVGDGATLGGIPVAAQGIYYSASAPVVHTQALLNELAYDSTQGKLYLLTGIDPTNINNWTPLLTDVRVDNETMELSTIGGIPNVLNVKTVSAAQLDANIAGTGLEFSGNTIQTTADQTFNSINLRTAAALQMPNRLQFGTVGGASQYTLPSFDGPNGYSLVTNGNGVLEWKPGNSVIQYSVLSGNQIPAGTIVLFGSGGNFATTVSAYNVPFGYLLCDGRELLSNNYTALFDAISTFYGSTSAGYFKIPSLTAADAVYLIKYLEDKIVQPVTISLENSLTGLNVTTTSVVTSFAIPQLSAVEFKLGVPDYVSKTYVDAQLAAFTPENTVYKLAKQSEPNCSNGTNALSYVMFIDQRTKAVRFSGLDRSGAAGIGNIQNSMSLVGIDVPIEFDDASEKAEEIYGAESTVFVLTNNGNVYAAGDNQYGINGTGNAQTGGINAANSKYTKLAIPAGAGKVTKISIGGAWYSGGYSSRHAFALTESGSAFAWGYNAFGQTGISTAVQPTQVIVPTSTHTGSLSSKLISKIYSFCGNTYGYSFAIDTTNGVHACGYGGSYNFGNNSTSNYNTGWVASNLTADEIYAAVGGSSHTTYLLSGGNLWGCGYNAGYQVGRNVNTTFITTFLPVSSDATSGTQLSGVSALSISDNLNGACTLIALMQDQTIRTWGYNATGQCGIGSTTSYVQAPTNSFAGSFVNANIVKVKAHGYYPYSSLFVLNSAGQIWSVGYNGIGQLGNGQTGSNSSIFTKVIQPKNIAYKDFNVYQDAGYSSHYTVAAIDTSNKLYCWGSNAVSQCGFANYPSYSYNNLTYFGTPLKTNFI